MEDNSKKHGLFRFIYKLKRFFGKAASNTAVSLQDCIAKVLKERVPASIVINILHWRDIIEWFQQCLNKQENVDKDTIGFTIMESAESGNYTIVQGIFNKESSSVEDARRITAEKVDEEVKHNCFKEKVTLFT